MVNLIVRFRVPTRCPKSFLPESSTHQPSLLLPSSSLANNFITLLHYKCCCLCLQKTSVTLHRQVVDNPWPSQVGAKMSSSEQTAMADSQIDTTASIPQETIPAQQGQLATPVAQPSSVSSAGENLQCQWQGCGERCATPELLYVRIFLIISLAVFCSRII